MFLPGSHDSLMDCSITEWLLASVGDVNAMCAPASSKQGSSDNAEVSFTQTENLEPRLADEGQAAARTGRAIPRGAEKDATLRKADQADTAAHIRDWLKSSGLKPPT